MSKKIFMLEWSVSYHELLAHELAKRGVQVLYWSAVENRGLRFSRLREIFPGIIIHNTFDAMRGLAPEGIDHWRFAPVDPRFLDRLLDCESEVISMMNRMDYVGDLSVNERKRLYYRMVRYWLGILSEKRPDAVVFSISPHMVFDYIAYRVCLEIGIRTIMFDYTRIPGRILRVERIDAGPILNSDSDVDKSATIEDLDPAIRAYYEDQIDPSRDSTPFYMGKYLGKKSSPSRRSNMDLDSGFPLHRRIGRKFKRKLVHWLNRMRVPPLTSLRPIGPFSYRVEKWKWERQKRQLRRSYGKFARNFDFHGPFIYAPLNYQPERTTSPLAGRFVSQELMIEMIAACIPDDWQVVVKEHPRQVFPGGSHAHQGRDPYFYSDLAKIPKVRLVTLDTPTFDLIEKCRAVATATGTAGWEGLIRGKPALIFGSPWYQACSGVLRVRTLEDCRSAVDTVVANRQVIEPNGVLKFLRSVTRSAVHGYVDPIFEKHSGIPVAESVRSIAGSVKMTLEKI